MREIRERKEYEISKKTTALEGKKKAFHTTYQIPPNKNTTQQKE